MPMIRKIELISGRRVKLWNPRVRGDQSKGGKRGRPLPLRGIRIMLSICVLVWGSCGAKDKTPAPVLDFSEFEETTGEESTEPAAEESYRTYEEMRSQMEVLFPKDGNISGWRMSGEVAFFDESDLYEHINGAAEAFFAYGFQLCGTAEYAPLGFSEFEETTNGTGQMSESPGDEFILVDIYDMGSAIQAFGMYASELYSESEAIDIGVQGYIESLALNFWKGSYYVKIAASSPAESLSRVAECEEFGTKANMELAKYIAQRIPGKAERPPRLSLLPTQWLLPGTERFILSNILGYSFLKNGLMASYQVGGEENSLIIAEYPSNGDAKDALAQFVSYEEGTGEGMARVTDLGEEGFAVNDRYYKRLIAVRQGRYLVVILAVTDETAARELLRNAIDNI